MLNDLLSTSTPTIIRSTQEMNPLLDISQVKAFSLGRTVTAIPIITGEPSLGRHRCNTIPQPIVLQITFVSPHCELSSAQTRDYAAALFTGSREPLASRCGFEFQDAFLCVWGRRQDWNTSITGEQRQCAFNIHHPLYFIRIFPRLCLAPYCEHKPLLHSWL